MQYFFTQFVSFAFFSLSEQRDRASGLSEGHRKLSWSQFNEFPHTTFNWIGLDGTQVLTHMTRENRT
jgi:alpha-mannosidase